MQRFLRHMQPLSIRIGDGENAGWYPSLVLDFEEGKEILVGVPTHRGYEVRVEPGTAVDVQTTHADGLRVFVATVLRREDRPGPALRLTWPRSVQRMQRREAVRVEVMVRVDVRVLAPGKEPLDLAGTTTDLSEGGMRLVLPEAVEPGTELEIRLHLPGAGTVECAGRLLRGGENEGATRDKHYWAAVEFAGTSAATRRELTRFVFDVQREQLRKGVA